MSFDWLEERLERIEQKIRSIEQCVYQNRDVLNQLISEVRQMSSAQTTAAQALTDLQNEVTAETTIDVSVETLITGLLTQVQTANGVSPAAVEAAITQMKANIAPLVASVSANTPPAPAPTAATAKP